MRISVPGAPEKIVEGVLHKAEKHSSFFTHDNGGRPIAVRLFPRQNVVKVFVRKYSWEKNKYTTERKPAFVFENVSKVFVGYGLMDVEHKSRRLENRMKKFLSKTVGNAFGLVRTDVNGDQVFTYVGISVENIKLRKDEKVIRYQSLVGNNDVPYGYLLTSRGAYTLASNNCANAFISNRKLEKAFGNIRNIPIQYDSFLAIDLWCVSQKETPIKPVVLLGRVDDMD